MERPDHIVIGAGVVGAATARALAARGRRVMLVEQFERGHDRGSSHGASRIFRQGYADAEYVAMTARALELWRVLEAETGEDLLTMTGGVDHGRPEVIDAIARALADAGVPFERLAPADATARWPGLVFEGSVLAHASAGRIRSDRALEALLALAERDGAELRFDCSVVDVSVDPAGDAVVELGSGEVIRAASVVAAVGSWAHPLLGGVLGERGVRLPVVRVTEEQPAHFRTDVPAEAWPSFVHHPIPSNTSSVEGGSADDEPVPGVYGLLTPGEGVKVGFHGTGPVIDADSRRTEPDPAMLAALIEYVEQFVPGADTTSIRTISCLYDNTPDEDFVLDRSGPITVATGFSGHGFKFAPLLGEMLADLATAPEPVSSTVPDSGHARPRFAFRG
jgi:sarcosine oxidase